MFSLKAFSATSLRLSASLLQPAANDEVLQCNVLFIHTTYLPKSKPRRLAYICDVYSHIHSTVVVDAVVVHSLYADSVSLSPQKKIHCKQK